MGPRNAMKISLHLSYNGTNGRNSYITSTSIWKLLDEEQKLEVKVSIVRQTINKAIIKYCFKWGDDLKTPFVTEEPERLSETV